ncbi:hypothetical protein G4B88_018134 [Cannabis sativa]|uniref:Uncharacterized protein n=1 Tax=Cannabis sativa TaxID=3483 RepID=A0A7J6DLV4_CANSA|nr:hypothetical protein G4B88_018134 [Cannabis sativa]
MDNINVDLELHDFIADSNFDQFIDLIRGENEDPLVNFGCDDLINGSNNFIHNNNNIINHHHLHHHNPLDNNNNQVFGFNANSPMMDKASIVGDAVLYVQDLQTQSKKLKAEIASLEASLEEVERYQTGSTTHKSNTNIKDVKTNDSLAKMKIITQMDMFQVEEKGFYVKVVCNKGEKAAISLYKALESLTNFNIKSSNLATVSDTFVLTFTLNVLINKECHDQREPMNLPNLKLWVTGAFINQGFELNTTTPF